MTEQDTYWGVTGMEEMLTCTDPEEAADEWLRDTPEEEWPETLTVMACVVDGESDGESYPLKRAPHMDRQIAVGDTNGNNS